jgi:hypothetical protein
MAAWRSVRASSNGLVVMEGGEASIPNDPGRKSGKDRRMNFAGHGTYPDVSMVDARSLMQSNANGRKAYEIE